MVSVPAQGAKAPWAEAAENVNQRKKERASLGSVIFSLVRLSG